MAGGIFTKMNKVRPGTYVNVVNGRPPRPVEAPVGIAMIPLIGYDWGPRDEWIHLDADFPDAEKAKFGRSIYDDNEYMMLLRLLFMNAVEVYAYIPGGGEKASGTVSTDDGDIKMTAKYAGELGNGLKVVSVANPAGGFDVSVVLNADEVEFFEGKNTAAEITSAYIDLEGDKALKAFASVSLSGGSDSPEKLNASVARFLDSAEKIKFNTMAFPTGEEALVTAAISKIKYIRNAIGWKCNIVVADTAADHEGVYNLTNAFVYEGRNLTAQQATAWLAGAAAGAGYNKSLTYKVVTDATAVVSEKSNEEAVQSIKAGETFFSVDESGNVILEYDVNSKVTVLQEDPPDIRKGRVCRVYDTFANDLLLSFPPGKYDNNPEGWKLVEGQGKAVLKRYQSDHAIKNVSLDEDFVVDAGQSTGDIIVVTVGIEPVDSAEKFYFTVKAR